MYIHILIYLSRDIERKMALPILKENEMGDIVLNFDPEFYNLLKVKIIIIIP